MTREQESARAMRLQNLLGPDYEVRYDDCESCLTRVYYKGQLIHEVPNSVMSERINVWDFAAPQEMLYSNLWWN